MHYITGEYDGSKPEELMKTYYEIVKAPQKTLTIIENTGHMPFMEAPENFAEAVNKAIGSENK